VAALLESVRGVGLVTAATTLAPRL